MTTDHIRTNIGTTSSAAFRTAVVPQAILLHDKDNYEEWKVRVKMYLLSQDLWEDVRPTDEPIPGRVRENFMALHAIQISCSSHPFSEIKNIINAREAWKTLADRYGGRDVAIEQDMPDQENYNAEDRNDATRITGAIYTGTLNIALGLIRTRPHLALVPDENGESPILALASMRHSFPSGNQLGFWKQCIYSCMRTPSSAPAPISETRLDFPNREQCQSNQEDQNNRSGIFQRLFEMKKIHVQSEALLSQMYEEISKSNTQQLKDGLVYTAICRAAKNGIFEFVSNILEPDHQRLLCTEDRNKRNIFMLAVLHRQEKIFSILYRLDRKMNDTLTSQVDVNENNMLHMAGMIEDFTGINKIPGAALQMQRELQWFKKVEGIVHPKFKESTNGDGLTPRQLFSKNHKKLMEKGEKWMKGTATSCTVVGALIVTIMFAVAFTVPGGNDQTTGFPIFLKKKLFKLFIICDALSLFFSSTSVLMFLGILTSSYAEEDFLEYLPRQMIIGLLTLFCSSATMIIAFSAALIIMLHDQVSWIRIPIICLACVPVIAFLLIQLRLLTNMMFSTYGSGLFDRKKKR